MTLLTPRQQSVFQRAVQRRSRGQVRLPALDLGRCDAIALWQNLVVERKVAAEFRAAD